MATPRIKTAIIGTGFMGRVHLEAVRRLGFVDVVGVAGRSADKARTLADLFGVEYATGDYRDLLREVQTDAVHICTPNAQHHAMAAAALDAGKHVMCEKPLAITSAEAADLVARASAKRLRNATCHNLRYYPMVQHMRCMRDAGELGDILIAQGTYSQDWLLHDSDWNWRVEASAGALRAMADIGTHWCDMLEHITSQRITSLCADLTTFHKSRKRPTQSVETFAGKMHAPSSSEDAPVETEDFGSVLFHLDGGARGAMTVSQVSAGCKNRLSMEIYGTKASVAWNQERPDELWIGKRDGANHIIVKDPSLLEGAARSFADLPGGHSEGYDDTFKQVFRRFYGAVLDPSQTPEYPQFTDGLRQMQLLDAVRSSNQQREWVTV
jgi:predicted dehydrogenase